MIFTILNKKYSWKSVKKELEKGWKSGEKMYRKISKYIEDYLTGNEEKYYV